MDECVLQDRTIKQTKTALRAAGFRFGDQRMEEAYRQSAGRVKREYLTGTAEEPASEPPSAPELPFAGIVQAPDAFRKKLAGKRFVFTCAQNNTLIPDDLWNSIQHFCKVKGAQLGIAKLTYNKAEWKKRGGVTKKADNDNAELWYDPKIEPYVVSEQVKVARGLVFCGELDILPTAVFPLNGLSNYTGHNSAIVPHTKMQMESLATMKDQPAKLMYTTGTLTARNYIERKAGQVASFHHVYGALYVEVDANGDWFARQLNADDNGLFYDLDRVYGPGTDSPAVELGRPLLNLGDVHIEKIDNIALLGAMNLMDHLNPEKVFLHDLMDFKARNHHNIKDPFFIAERHRDGDGSVIHGFYEATRFLSGMCVKYPDTEFYVIRSNHDDAFKLWLKNPMLGMDPVNARFWHLANYTMYTQISAGVFDFDIFVWALQFAAETYGHNIAPVKFVKEDESLVINGIEYGMHGHLGPNGARGNPKGFRQLGRRANTGHTHSAGIVDGVWTAGVLGSLDMGYNRGPSSWSHSHIITYPNGKRTIVTQRGSQWRAND